MATYNANIPAPNDDLSVSQGQIQGNFDQANISMGIDHFNFENVAGDTGKHKYTTFVDIASTTPATAAPVTTADELAFFVKQVGTDPRIHFRQISNGTEVQLTGADPIATATGETTMMGGIGIKWGTLSVVGIGPTALDYTTAGLTDFGTNTFVVTLGGNVEGIQPGVTAKSATGFSLKKTTVGTSSVDWIAIGV